MTKQTLEKQWSQLRQKYVTYLRLLEAIPAERYHSQIVPGMHTPAELAVQTSAAIVKEMAQGIAVGEIRTDESPESRIMADMGTKLAVINYAKKCWGIAEDAVATIDDAQLDAMVVTPWGTTFPGWVGMTILNDEFLHHFGQLYTYARLCGVEPPFLWDFIEETPQYQFAG